MPDSVILKGFAILDTIQLKSVDELVKELQQIPGLKEIGVGNELLSFRLKGGPTMLIKLKEFSSLTKGGTASTAFPPLMILNTIKEDSKANVVGADRGENRQNKKALVLAPYAWEFGQTDDPLIPLKKLPKNRNYKGGVNYKANKTKTQQNITLEDYLSFNDYDVVHLGTHRAEICNLMGYEVETTSNCHSYISSGITYKKEDRQELIDYIKNKNIRGISFSPGELFFIPEFFASAYPNVNNKLFILSACQLGQRGDLEITFNQILQNAQLFYWHNTVFAEDALKAFSFMYDRMLEYGETAPLAFENTPYQLKENLRTYENDEKRGDSIEVNTYLKMATKGNAMHIIEPVSFLDSKTKKELQEGVVYPFEGILEDEVAEEASFTIEFLGYTTQEIEAEGMTFSLNVDGNTVLDHVSFLPNTDPYDNIEVESGKNNKTTIVTFKGVNLKKDLQKNSTVKLEALFHLSEENYGVQIINVSTGSSDMRIVMKSPDGTINMFFDADNYGLKMTHPAENATLYSDEEGYIYMNAPGKGWMKTKLTQMFSAMAKHAPIDIDFMALETKKGSVMHKIAAFAGEITISRLET
ncbi:hypothetical protein GCM10007383_32420 [Arenibacter certesii]|uniref:Uncharacterized protein n=2 Tax=Arenibacter certesii TaxID=228955 RepID=A0A918J3X9_9FLAO|nr:hypothetical protein GCM10007383_32420 [Arenibacter certesii]